MFQQMPNQSKLLCIAILLFSSTIFAIESKTNIASAQSSKEYLRSSCDRAYQNYQNYSNQPVSSPMDSSFSTSSHNMRMANQALNMVTNCAIKYSNLVQNDSRYCSDAISYTRRISPIMSTTAVTINYRCSR